MCVGKRWHYRISDIHGRHFVRNGLEAGLPTAPVRSVIEDVIDRANDAIDETANGLPKDFPVEIHDSVAKVFLERWDRPHDGCEQGLTATAKFPQAPPFII